MGWRSQLANGAAPVAAIGSLPSIEAAGLENYWKENSNSTHRSAPNVPKRDPAIAHKYPEARLIGMAWWGRVSCVFMIS